MQVCGQYFTKAILGRIQAAASAEPAPSRRALARQVCQWLDWRSPGGQLKEMSCRTALAELNRRGALALPECTQQYAFQKRREGPVEPLAELRTVEASLRELGEVEVVLVPGRASSLSKIWNWLMGEYHYLGKGPLCGAQLRYLIRSSEYGWLGGLSFSSATWRLGPRDRWIEWSEAARRQNLHQVVCNSRLLILPTVRVPQLASHVLGTALRRLRNDWNKRYGYRPVLVESFVDRSRFAGTTYRAANFTAVGYSAARNDPHPNGKVSHGPKEIYLYPLERRWKKKLCLEPEPTLGAAPAPDAPRSWAEEEFGRIRLSDDRLKQRLYLLAEDFFAQPGQLIPQACSGSEAKTKAAYRFMKNKQINLKMLLQPHVEATIQRCQAAPVVLAVQDTTSLNYTGHASEDMGPINTKRSSAVGVLLHETLAFTPAGLPLGLLDAQCWTRKPGEAGKAQQRKELPIEQKESCKWLTSYRAVAQAQQLCPETKFVSVGDREADIYELFSETQQAVSGPRLLVRADKARTRTVKAGEQQEQAQLWAYMQAQDSAGKITVKIPPRKQRPARDADLQVRYAHVDLQPPKGKQLPAVPVWAVYVKEHEPPADVAEPLEWMLLTTVETSSFEEASERIAWYTKRWGIELYHRVLKGGCRIEDRQLDACSRTENCLAIDLVVGWRVYSLLKQGRETPDLPCDVFLSEDEWKVLAIRLRKPLDQPVTMREAMRAIAGLGGFLGRKCDRHPGVTTTWRGLVVFLAMVEGYRLAMADLATRAP